MKTSNMDYEKLYKEAIARIRKYTKDEYGCTRLKPEDIFPELAESEDERMVQYFKDLAPFDKAEELYEKYGFSHKDAIAWLEKKCEQKSVKVPKFKVGDFIQYNGMGHTRYTVKEVCGLSHYINTCNKRMDMSYTDANFELVEQKPAEWSDEDENIIRLSIENLTELEDRYGKEYGQVGDCIDWLESLRPQSTWKPTEQQMKVLNEVINFAADHGTMRWNDYIYNVLKSLREQLKKLTE